MQSIQNIRIKNIESTLIVVATNYYCTLNILLSLLHFKKLIAHFWSRETFDHYYDDYYDGDVNFQYNEVDRIGLSFDEDYYEEEVRRSKFLEPIANQDDVLICEATSTFKDQIGIEKWCTDNCNHVPRNCPESMCVCRGSAQETFNEIETVILSCKPTQPFKHVSGMTKWCEDNCNGATKFCPETFCNCM